MFHVCLKALVIANNVSYFATVWTGASLRDLSSDDFYIIKKFYGLKNLFLTCSYSHAPFNFDDL